MKKVFLVIAIAALFTTACNKQNAAPETPIEEMPDEGTAVLKYSGAFMRGEEGTIMGTANLYESLGKYQLELKDFSVTNGPDLHVYLSKEVMPVHFIDLGELKSSVGNQLYEIPGMPDFAEYKYALIHCQQYNVLFGSSELK